ncbi:MAG: S49 family peptidase [Thalassobaculum sp.]|uniref:S49 family peptidase n=1 Tax=Thalassobaculum sp. TaxID=2022740 RepID=UPI0032EB0CE7
MSWFDPILDRVRGRPPIVSVVPLRGVIGSVGPMRRGLTVESLAPLLEAAFRPRSVTAVALVVNSPGGSPAQSELIAGRIRDLAAETEKPVVAFVEDVAASGGYWLACAADEIRVTSTSIVGSIGVISAGFGFQDALSRLGVERRVHTAGSRKALLDPFRPENPDDVAHLKAIQGELHARFIDWVRERRGDRLKPDEDPELLEGKFWTGPRGVALGLADGEGELRRTLRERYGARTRFRTLSRRPGLMRRFGLAQAGATALGAGTADGEGLFGGFAESLISAVEERALWSRFGL